MNLAVFSTHFTRDNDARFSQSLLSNDQVRYKAQDRRRDRLLMIALCAEIGCQSSRRSRVSACLDSLFSDTVLGVTAAVGDAEWTVTLANPS